MKFDWRIRRRAVALAVATTLAGFSASVIAQSSLDDVGGLSAKPEIKINYSALDGKHQHDRLIVSFAANERGVSDQRAMYNHLDAVAAATGQTLTHVRTLGTGAELVQLGRANSDRDLRRVMEALAASPMVEYVEPDARMYPMYTPNDSSYSSQWHYFESTGGMNLPLAWDIATGAGVTVAVLDTGITSHTDLNANVVAGYDFVSDAASARDGNGRDSNPADQGDWSNVNECYSGDPGGGSSWHGTHVAGTIAAVTGNGSGVAGVAFGAKISPVRVLAKCGGSLSDIADAIIWASGGSVSGVPANSNPSKVINMSLGGGGSCGTTYQNAINSAVSRGTVVVVAAGNENTNASNSRPANCANVVTVAATNRSGGRSYYSNYGSVVDVSAPGGELTQSSSSNGVLSTLNAGSTTPGSQSYAYYQGTSMATPHVAGLAALILSQGSKTPAEIESILKSTARPLPGSCSGGCGAGIVDSLAALQSLGGGGGGGGGGNTLTNGVAVTGLAASTGAELRYTMDVPAGASNLSFVIAGGSGDADLYVRFGSEPSTTTYECRPYLNGNNESCSFPAPQTGTYHVMLRAYSSFSGVSLTGSYTAGGGGGGGGQSFFENTTNFTISDYADIYSPITVSGRSGNAPSNLQVHVNIVHTYIGDLQVYLIAPDGSSYTLHNRSGGGTDNINQTYTVNA
ncbi:MAG: S8 family serine peptidase, partial [Xanthomonadales bacterium]|nr:S8 family serine peptidase [Xanthomonadales bacterium]